VQRTIIFVDKCLQERVEVQRTGIFVDNYFQEMTEVQRTVIFVADNCLTINQF